MPFRIFRPVKVIHIGNGPNLNLLGLREPEIYGTVSFEDYLPHLRETFPGIDLHYLQSNHEGVLIDYLHQYGFAADTGFVLNAGGLSHTSIALRDAVAAIPAPVAEVHISDIASREPFRRHSYLTEVCALHVSGKGLPGYAEAIAFLAAR